MVGIPALVDNLALVYNKTLFVGPAWTTRAPTGRGTTSGPREDPDGSRHEAVRVRVSDGRGRGLGVALGPDALAERRLDPVGGRVAGGVQLAGGGVEALEVLAGMAVDDGSVFLDIQNSAYTNLFNSGRIAMLVTGPWDLASFPDVDYGVEILPGFDDDHQTIAGPDMVRLRQRREARGRC